MAANPGFFPAPTVNMTHMTKEQFTNALPKQIQNKVSTSVMDSINNVLNDEPTRDHFRDNFVGYTSVLTKGKFKIQSYIDAVKYVSFKLLGNNNKDSYAATFVTRYNTLIAEGATEKNISAYVAMYNKNKLVNMIWEQTLIPTHVLNADRFQDAINVQCQLMGDPMVSDKVRCDAANSLLNTLKQPEIHKVELDIGIKESTTIEDLKKTMTALASLQREAIEDKTMSTKEVAHSKLLVTNKDGVIIEAS